METPWIKGAFPFGLCKHFLLSRRQLTLLPGFMHDMSGVIAADQLMASNGQPTALGSYILSGNY